MNKYVLSICFLFIVNIVCGQTDFVVLVKDSITHQPIDYASLSYSKKAFLTNEFGEAILKYNNRLDTLFISYVGYHTQKIPILKFSPHISIYISKKENTFNEIKVIGYTLEKLAKLLISAY